MGFYAGGDAAIQFLGCHSIDSAGHRRFCGPAARMRLRCRGDRIALHLDADGVHFDLLIDGEKQWLSPRGMTPASMLAGAEPGSQTKGDSSADCASFVGIARGVVTLPLPAGVEVNVELRQRSESAGTPMVLRGIEIGAGCLLPVPAMPPQQQRARIEFIGDSYFVGYGNLLPEQAPERDGLPAATVSSHTDSQRGMAALCGDALAMDWRISAVSGRGLVRNYAGVGGRCMPEIYAQTRGMGKSGQNAAAPARNDFPADIVAINLGSNDFSTSLHEYRTEPFADAGALAAAWCRALEDFLADLSRWHGEPLFVLVGVPHPESPRQRQLLQQWLAEVADNPGFGRGIHYCELPSVPLHGCDAHPGLEGHADCARHLAAFIQQLR
ncbi:hypothetical protein Maes01_02071 [Microbulbifer aestuariivivens]|uniref:GDSL family lipase n=1 Tax=Microbulbifer aestuariivivens TaxID=1908308 RepID=A0ABP9WSR8_9GAMM